MSKESEELLPCPFCGSEGEFDAFIGAVTCTGCQVVVYAVPRTLPAWNKRVHSPEGRTVEDERKRHLPSEQIDNDLYKAHCGYLAEYKEDVWATPCYEFDRQKLYEIAVDKLTCPKCAEWYAHLATVAIGELQDKIKQTQDNVRKEGVQ